MTIQRSIVVLATVATLSPFLHGCVPLIAGGAAGSALLVGSDRRSSGAYVDDQTLEVKIGQQIGAEQPDAHVNVTSFNRAAERIIGISREQALGCRCSEVFRASVCERNCA